MDEKCKFKSVGFPPCDFDSEYPNNRYCKACLRNRRPVNYRAIRVVELKSD